MNRVLANLLVTVALVMGATVSFAGIDRHALVTRHNVTLTSADPLTPLTVGNSSIGFTVDITGLQSFPDFHTNGTPLHTLSSWGWHSFPNPESSASRMRCGLTTRTGAR